LFFSFFLILYFFVDIISPQEYQMNGGRKLK